MADAALIAVSVAALAGCGEQNTFQPPPPAEVAVARPEKRTVTRYLELTGQTAASLKVDLVARVQGTLEKIGYIDGAQVAAGTLLFSIERATYETSLEIAEASVAQQQALLAQTEADFSRKSALVERNVTTGVTFEDSRSKRDQAAATLNQAQGEVQQAKINLGYTEIKAPFAGRVSARLADVGSLVGAGGPTKLATILQLDPVYVNFSINEQQVLLIRQGMRERGVTLKDLGPIPVEIGLQTETGYPHVGQLDYVAPDLDPGTGTLAVRANIPNKANALLPGLFVRVRLPVQRDVSALLVPERAIGTSQSGSYVLLVNAANQVEQRAIEPAEQVDGGFRIVTSGITAEDRVIVSGIQRAVPGAVVKPMDKTATAGVVKP
ncbi:MAG: efflux RND transporter periplasmic adaptor subunit [Chitinophagales bacterium]|nr:efflux RND transporter periplasmic adaptor subunit [Hyphomicrobiales bacterium]